MNIKETNNQQLSDLNQKVESSETIPIGSTHENVEAVSTLTSKVEGEDIVQNLKGLNKFKSKEIFLEKAYEKYGNKFNYNLNNYNGLTKNKIKIICLLHGEFEQILHTFLLKNCKTGCKKCGIKMFKNSKTNNIEDVLKQFNDIYNYKYKYVLDDYVNKKSKIKIICKEHGEFIKSAQKHLSGQGCFHCNIKELIKKNILVGGYSEVLFQNNLNLKNTKAYLYYLSINNNRLFKIGISKSINSRIKNIKHKSKGFIKNIDLIWFYEDTLYNCYKKEQEILEKYKDNRVYFKFSTEIFNKNILPLKLF